MSNRRNKSAPAAVSELLTQIAEWREQRTKRGRMPETLWSEATRLGREYGVSLVSRHLKLDYHGLKRRVFGNSEISRKQKVGFVELRCVDTLPATDTPRGAFVTELEFCRRGEETMRVRQSGPTGIDLSEIVESFLGRN